MNSNEIKRCACNWNQECYSLQQALIKQNQILGGCIEIRLQNPRNKNNLSYKNEALKQSFVRHLKPQHDIT